MTSPSDVMADRLGDGGQFWWLSVLNDFNRKGRGIEVDFSLAAEPVIRSLDRIMEWRGKPGTIMVDNGPDCISTRLLEWYENTGLATSTSNPDSHTRTPVSSATPASSGMDGLTDTSSKPSKMAQDFATQWLRTSNNDSPTMGIGGITPA